MCHLKGVLTAKGDKTALDKCNAKCFMKWASYLNV